MDRYQRLLRRFLELVSGQRAERLREEYAQAGPEDREARTRFVEEKAKHRIVAAATALGVAIVTLVIERMLPEA